MKKYVSNIGFAFVFTVFAVGVSSQGFSTEVYHEIGKNLTLVCPTSFNSSNAATKPYWSKENIAVQLQVSLKDRYNETENKFVIRQTVEDDFGLYSCSANGSTYDFNVKSNILVNRPANQTLTEGQKLVLNCSVSGKPRPVELTVIWNFSNGTHNSTINRSTEHIQLMHDVRGGHTVFDAILTINETLKSDTGDYTCSVADSTLLAVVKVRGAYDAWWVFMGIVIEVAILCMVIFWFEYRHNKNLKIDNAKMDDSDNELDNEQKTS